jgi:hypothetical protein
VIAEAHGGVAEAANGPAGGADVWLVLPGYAPPSTRSSPSSGSVSQEASERT